MTGTVVAIFATVYLGMIIGGLPFLQLARARGALRGARRCGRPATPAPGGTAGSRDTGERTT